MSRLKFPFQLKFVFGVTLFIALFTFISYKTIFITSISILQFSHSSQQRILPPFKNFQTTVRFTDKYGLATCVIPKSMSTVLASTMCYLYDSEGFLREGRTLTTDGFWTRFCEGLNEENNITRLYYTYKEVDWKWFVVVRDPFERFVSTYVDKCVYHYRNTGLSCYNCTNEHDIDCVINTIESRAWQLSTSNLKKINFFDTHFFPQNWHCNFADHMDKYKVITYASHGSEAYDKFINNIEHVFADSDIPSQHVNYVVSNLTLRTTGHATISKPERSNVSNLIKSNKALMKKLINLYFFDYILFNFKLPQ